MEECFTLKHYGHLSLFEQAQMTGEERRWWARRLEKDAQQRAEAEKKQQGSRPRMPRMRRK